MKENEVEGLLIDALANYNCSYEETTFNVGSFKEHGLLTSNKGVVIRFDDGSEFQLTIVRSW